MPKTVLITGGAGFIGHHMIKYLLEATDWNLVSLDRLDFSGNLNRLAKVVDNSTKDRVKVVFHDLKADINDNVAEEIGHVDIIIHAAAGSHVDRSIEDPMSFVMDNVVGTGNILNFARRFTDLERFIYFSTDEVFGPAPKGVLYQENDRYNSTNPYSATKAGGEELAVAFHNTYGVPVFITHTMNVIGEYQTPEKYVPMCIDKISKGETVTIHSNPEKTAAGSRHYIHADDVASAILFLLNLKDYKEPPGFGNSKCPKFNIVGYEELSNLELANIIANIIGKPLNYEMVDFHSQRPGHDLRYAMSGAKLASLGWTPKEIRERLVAIVEERLKKQISGQ